MTLEAGNTSAPLAAPYEQPKPVPKKKVETEEKLPVEPPIENTPEPLAETNNGGKLEELLNICKENKLMSLLVVVAAGTLAYYIVDSYVLQKK